MRHHRLVRTGGRAFVGRRARGVLAGLVLALLGAWIALACGSRTALRLGESEQACGDKICASDESCTSCFPDCGLCASCGDGVCSADESCSSCVKDCGVCTTCPNGACDGDETCGS